MPPPTLIPLVVRSHHSLMRGAASPEALCRAARRMGYDRLALTDRDNLYGLWSFLPACRREGIAPIVGAEVTEPGSRRRCVCLAETSAGYANLCRLITRRHRESHRESGFDIMAAVADMGGGLRVLTDDPHLLAAWRGAGIRVAGLMGRRPLPRSHPLRRAAARCAVPCVAAPDSFFISPDDHAIHRLLRAIDRNTTLSRLAPEDTAPPDAFLAPPSEYARRFAPCPEAISETAAIADAIAFTGPDFGTVMPPWRGAGYDADSKTALRSDAYAGAIRRYGPDLPEPVVDRLEKELSIIATKGFSAYFLIVRDIVAHSPRTCGRGSGAASLVAYCLGITNVCPVKHNLYFERFLHPERLDPPDIDVDFPWDERDGVIDSVLETHLGHAAMVASHVLFQPRMAVRETARVFGLPDGEIGRVTRRMPWHWGGNRPVNTLLATLRALPEARGLRLDPPWPEILALAGRIIGVPRHLSVHPGGVVITPDPIDTYVPVETAQKGVPVIQWDKDAAEDAGLVKIDLLGNRSLAVVRDAMASIRENGEPFNEAGWEPEDDPATQSAVAAGDTMGCFYIESPATRQLQKKAAVGDFAHLVIHSSIIRPAANACIQEYLRRLHGGAWKPLHPLLADILDETFGIMVYQEDVSRAAMALADFSHAEADRLRKIISKKDRERHLADYRRRFAEGAAGRGVSEDVIEAAWEMMMSFDGYSFCKPHSASYARVSFQSAYLKTHHPAEFMAAVINNGGGYYSTFAYVSEARRMGLSILPPDVNRGENRWRGNGRTLRVGWMAVAGLSHGTRERIAAARDARHFADLADFLDRARPSEPEGLALIHAGALDGLMAGERDSREAASNRSLLIWGLRKWLHEGRDIQPGLFDAPPDAPPPLPPEDARRRLRREYAALGFLLDRHPITLHYGPAASGGAVSGGPASGRPVSGGAAPGRPVSGGAAPGRPVSGDTVSGGMVKANRLRDHVGRNVRMIAWLITGKRVRTRHGDTMEFLTFEDETGLVETTFFPKAYARWCHLLETGRPFLLTGRVETNWDAVTLTVDRVGRLDGGGAALSQAEKCFISMPG